MNPWWQNFFFDFTVAAVVMGALCWHLWRKRNEESERSGSQYFQDKVRSEMQPASSDGMRVFDLIHMLQQHDPAATVVLWEHSPYEGRVALLGMGEVQPIRLGARESVGLVVLEPWADGNEGLEGPFPGVVLGSS